APTAFSSRAGNACTTPPRTARRTWSACKRSARWPRRRWAMPSSSSGSGRGSTSGKRSAIPNLPPTTSTKPDMTLNEAARAYAQAKAYYAAASKNLDEAHAALVALADKKPEGAVTTETDAYKVTVTYGVNRTVDQAA